MNDREEQAKNEISKTGPGASRAGSSGSVSESLETTVSGRERILEPRSSDSGSNGSQFELQEPIAAGQTLFNRYLVIRQLGEGGMGQVWLVRHLELDCERALKFIMPQFSFDAEVHHRFAREARMMAGFQHPNVVVVHDARLGSNAGFIEMEYIRGQSLNQILKPGVPMPLDWTARVLEQLCDVLQTAHEGKIVHRDLKPGNLMLVADRPRGKEFLKVLDFGIAKILGYDNQDSGGKAITQGFLGTVLYASPEQLNEDPVDGRSDIYSVGVILYEFLTGHRPFSGRKSKAMLDHVSSPVPPFRQKNPDLAIPERVEQVVLRCLAKQPKDRYQTARELYEAFLQAIPPMAFGAGLSGPGSGSSLSFRFEPDSSSTPHSGATSGISGFALSNDQAAGSALESGLQAWQLETEYATESLTKGFVAPSAESKVPVVEPPSAPKPRQAEPQEHVQKLEQAAGPRRTIKVKVALASLMGMILLLSAVGLALWASQHDWQGPQPPTKPVQQPTSKLEALYRPESGTEWVDGWPAALVRKSDGTRFLLIDGSDNFRMGAFEEADPEFADEEKPAHIRRLSRYYIQETEVTIGEVEDYIRAQGIARKGPELEDYLEMYQTIQAKDFDQNILRGYPAVGISRRLAEAIARSFGGELPTEAQWEFAARSRGKHFRYVWGDDDEGLYQKPKANLANDDRPPLMRVKIPSSLRQQYEQYWEDQTEQGVFDMTGSVREWCRDVWRPYRSRALTEIDYFEKPLDEPTGDEHEPPVRYVIRGGSFYSPREAARTTYRLDSGGLDFKALDLGFRVVLEVPEEVPGTWQAYREGSVASAQP